MAIEHPAITLLAFVDSDFEQSHVEELRRATAALAASRDDWVLGPPQFVDETDNADIRTVGVVHRVHAAFDEAGRLLDEAVDRKQLEEVRLLISSLQEVSARTGIDLGLELDGGSVGWVEQGELSEDLRVGLLDSWAGRFS